MLLGKKPERTHFPGIGFEVEVGENMIHIPFFLMYIHHQGAPDVGSFFGVGNPGRRWATVADFFLNGVK